MMTASERLKNQIAYMVLSYNYWGALFSQVTRKPTTFEALQSIMGVAPEKDGTLTLYYCPELVDKTDDATILKVLEHEGIHILNKHLPRLLKILADEPGSEATKRSKAKIWNFAADCSTNELIGLKDPLIIDGKPWKPLLPDSFDPVLAPGQFTEVYYYELLKRLKSTGQIKFKGKGKGTTEYLPFDNHEGWSKNVEGVADLSSLAKNLDNHIQKKIRESLKQFQKQRGNLPAYLRELIDRSLMAPTLPYYQIIYKLIRGTRLSKFKRSDTVINRKRTYTFDTEDGIPDISPFPGRKRDRSFNIAILIDTSGSMDAEDIAEALSGTKQIIENDRNCLVHVVECDAAIGRQYRVRKIKDINPEVTGRGGTQLGPGLFEVKKTYNPDVCLAFTDGYTEDINAYKRSDLPKKLIWVINANGTIDNLNKTGYIVRVPK